MFGMMTESNSRRQLGKLGLLPLDDIRNCFYVKIIYTNRENDVGKYCVANNAGKQLTITII